MKLEAQVVSLDLAKKLKELGVQQESLFYYGRKDGTLFARTGIDDLVFGYTTLNAENPGGDPYWFDVQELDDDFWFSAFTVAELGEMLPPGYRTQKEAGMWLAIASRHVISTDREFALGANTEADARAEMLISLIEKNIVKP